MTTEVEGEGGQWGVATLKLPTQKYLRLYSLVSGPRVLLQRGLISGRTSTYSTHEISGSEHLSAVEAFQQFVFVVTQNRVISALLSRRRMACTF
jgi:hypothetical protein